MADHEAPRGSFTFIGNATALVRWGPFTLLTDPNFLHADQRDRVARRLLPPVMGSLLREAVECRGLGDRVTYVERGDTVPLVPRPAA